MVDCYRGTILLFLAIGGKNMEICDFEFGLELAH